MGRGWPWAAGWGNGHARRVLTTCLCLAVVRAQKKEKRHITFSKRKAGIMKKVSPTVSR